MTHKESQIHTGDKTKTKQEFRDSSDINEIMRKWLAFGTLPQMIKDNPRYGDYASVPNFQEALNIVVKAREQFEALPAKVRERFKHSPEEFLKYATDEKNLEGMAELGLLNENGIKKLKENRQKEAEERDRKAVEAFKKKSKKKGDDDE